MSSQSLTIHLRHHKGNFNEAERNFNDAERKSLPWNPLYVSFKRTAHFADVCTGIKYTSCATKNSNYD